MSQEIRVVAFARAKTGQEAALEEAITAVVSASREEAGCRFYTAHLDLDHPGRYVFVERWDSVEALAEHAKTEHFHTFVAAITPLLEGELEVIKLKELA